MCGIWGFMGGKFLDYVTIDEIIRLAGTRGPHAHGAIWYDGKTWAENKMLGPVENNITYFQGLTVRGMLGHCRLATSGDIYNFNGIQPFMYKKFAFAHNGNFYNADQFRTPKETTASDSMILGRVIHNQRLKSILKSEYLNTPYVIVLMTKFGFITVRDWLPLYFKNDKQRGTVYICSREFEGSEITVNQKITEFKYERVA